MSDFKETIKKYIEKNPHTVTILEMRDRIEQLEPYKDELEKIAEDLGEKEDPFAAWEAVEALKAKLAAEKALAGNLIKGQMIQDGMTISVLRARIDQQDKEMSAWRIKYIELGLSLEVEKALADILSQAIQNFKSGLGLDDANYALATYRKARGL